MLFLKLVIVNAQMDNGPASIFSLEISQYDEYNIVNISIRMISSVIWD